MDQMLISSHIFFFIRNVSKTLFSKSFQAWECFASHSLQRKTKISIAEGVNQRSNCTEGAVQSLI